MSGTTGSTGRPAVEVEMNAKGLPVQWNGEHWDFYKAVMISQFERFGLEGIADGTVTAPTATTRTSVTGTWTPAAAAAADDSLEDGAAGSGSAAATRSDEELAEWKKKQGMIKGMILGSISLNLANRVMRKPNGTAMWQALVEMYEAPQNQTLKVHQQRQLLHKLWHTRARKDDDMAVHLGKLYEFRDRLETLKYAVHDVDMVDAMLSSLPRHAKYLQLANMITLNPAGSTSVDDVRDLILVAASQLKEEGMELSGGRATAGANRNGGADVRAGKAGNPKGQPKQNKPREVKCFHCHKVGHIKKNCPEREPRESSSAEVAKPRVQKSDADSCVQEAEHRQELPEPGVSSEMEESIDAEDIHSNYNARRWVYDTGSSGHVVGTMKYFVTYYEFEECPEPVKGFAKGIQTSARGIGSIALTTDIGHGALKTIILEDVAYVPDVNWNLFSAGLARKQGFIEKKNEATGEYKLYRGNELVLRSSVGPNNVWTFDARNLWISDTNSETFGAVANFTVADGVASIRTWHARLGHTCAQHLKQMADKELVDGMFLKGRELPSCVTCEVAKQKRAKHNVSFERDHQGPNDTIYVDLMEPGHKNPTRYTHVLVIVDGYSRWTTVYMLKSKTETSEHLKNYVAWAERQVSRPVKKIVSDTGSEFVNETVKTWCAERGIQPLTIAPGGSSVNYAERSIQTLRNTMKTMLKHSGLPYSLWPDALRHACYIRNRVLCSSTMKTPFEMFYGKKPDLHRIRTFGALIYAHIPKHLRPKHADTSDVGFLLGYSEENMGTKVYFPQFHTARVVYTVRVNEEILYRDRQALPPSVVGWIADQHDDVEGGERDSSSESSDDDMDSDDSNSSSDDEVMNENEDQNVDDIETSLPLRSRAYLRSMLDEQDTEHNNSTDNDEDDVACEDVAEEADGDADDDQYDEEEDSEPCNGENEPLVSDVNEADDNENELAIPDEDDSEGFDHVDDDDDNPEPEEAGGEDNAADAADTDYGEANDNAGEDDYAENDDGLVEPECIKVETWGLEQDEQSIVERERDIVDSMRSLSETPNRSSKHQRDPVVDRREDNKKQRFEPREPKRSRREHKLPKYLEDYVLNATLRPSLIGRRWKASEVNVPRTFREAMRSRQADEWKAAMEREMQALREKGVLTLIEKLPEGQHVIDTKWVYDLKVDENGYIVRFRARVVARGFKQIPGLDFLETFSPVARLSTMRLLLALAVALGWKLWSGDVNNAYLNAKLKIKQYIRHIDGFPDQDGIFRVDQALYGLKQSGREWNEEIDSWMKERGFSQCKTEPCLYFYASGDVLAFVLLYVDDVICTSNSEGFKCKLFADLGETYGFKDLGLLTSYLGIRVRQTETGITIDQEEYARKLCDKFDLKAGQSNRCGIPMETSLKLKKCEQEKDGNCQHIQGKVPYREAIGSLMYLVTGTRPDLMFVVGQLSRFVEHPTEQHFGALKRVMRYLLGTVEKGITFEKRGSLDIGLHLQGHSDSDWANDVDTRKSTTGYVFTLTGGAVSWASRRQTIVAQSTAEAEYVAACEAAMEGKALMNILDEILPEIKCKITLGVDNQSSYVMATNPTFGRRTRHIELKWHYVREQVMKKELYLLKVKSVDNPADLFTKPLAKQRFELLSRQIGMTTAKAA